jgi:hypothetical protein
MLSPIRWSLQASIPTDMAKLKHVIMQLFIPSAQKVSTECDLRLSFHLLVASLHNSLICILYISYSWAVVYIRLLAAGSSPGTSVQCLLLEK